MRERRYPSDLTDTEWGCGGTTAAGGDAAPAGWSTREASTPGDRDAILYVVRSGCAWRQLPADFPPWETVYWYFGRWEQQKLTFRLVDALEMLQAPPRLVAHLRAVHDVACQLTEWLQQRYPDLEFDREAVAFGAAIHDIGKVKYPSELCGPGSAHEEAGYGLLLDQGVEDDLARFARTHADWTAIDVGTEDLLVSLADKVWKAKRVAELEQLVTERLAAASGQQPWEVFMTLDDVLDRIAADADSRLAFQASYPIAV